MNAFFRILHDLFGFHKMKMLFVLMFTLLFTLMMFPGDDLSDWVSAQITRRSGVYVQLDNLGISLLPSPGIEAENVVIESRGMPALRAGSIDTSISLFKIITGKLGVSADIGKLFGGDIRIDYAQDGKAKSGGPFDEISVRAERVNLDDVADFLSKANLLSIRLQGSTKLDLTRLRIDRGMGEQPSGLVNLEIPAFTIPSQTVMVDFNGVMVPQQIPSLELGRLSLKNAKLSDGLLEIPELVIGTPQGEFHGKAKGSLGLNFRKIGNMVQPEVSSVNLSMRILADKSFFERHNKTVIGGFMMLIPQNLKQETGKGTEIAFNMKIDRLGVPPTFTPTSEKF